jgi:hypothetical protein
VFWNVTPLNFVLEERAAFCLPGIRRHNGFGKSVLPHPLRAFFILTAERD